MMATAVNAGPRCTSRHAAALKIGSVGVDVESKLLGHAMLELATTNDARVRDRKRLNSHLVGCRPHGRGDGVGQPVPGGRLLAESPAPGRRQRVVPNSAVTGL
jgi:hypothetical protein